MDLTFKWIMFQLSIMFVAREIKQKLLCKFSFLVGEPELNI